jgi:predicted O-methyltransferase YrrM
VLPDRHLLLEHLPRGGTVAEIGVAYGDYSAEILRRNGPARLHLVDAWRTERYSPALEQIKSRFVTELSDGRIMIAQGLSTDILPRFEDAYFDWVYIDTDHTFDTTFAELCICDRKVKQGGRIAGHDFCCGNVITPVPYGVIEACLKFCVDFSWQFEFLTVEFSGNPSFALMRL